MQVLQQSFGEVDGEIIYAFTIKNSHGLEITCLNYGCIITKILMADNVGRIENIVLGFDTIEEYLERSPYFGAVIGRVAGRIKGGEFTLNGTTYHLAKNEGENHLHGGIRGFNNVFWKAVTIEKGDSAGIEFFYTSLDGEERYPGNLEMKVVYTLDEDNQFKITYEGVSDQMTLLNVTNHTYFNLSGNLKRDILNHNLTMKSDQFFELDEHLLPTGNLLDVTETPFDFRCGRDLKDGVMSLHEQNHIAGNGYDHPFLFSDDDHHGIVLRDNESGREITVETEEPCVVLYSGNQLTGDFEIRGVKAHKYLGVCLETQGPPDAIHHPEFTSCILEKGATYHSETLYTFKAF